jgi:hypothetical protein
MIWCTGIVISFSNRTYQFSVTNHYNEISDFNRRFHHGNQLGQHLITESFVLLGEQTGEMVE